MIRPLIRILGVGSPFGEDAVGLEVARILAQEPPVDCQVIIADRPGLHLLELLDGAGTVILIDAMRSGAAPGTLHEIQMKDLAGSTAPLMSSHDLGVVDSLRLGLALGRVPPETRLLGIEVAAGHPTEIAIASAAARVRSLVEELRRDI